MRRKLIWLATIVSLVFSVVYGVISALDSREIKATDSNAKVVLDEDDVKVTSTYSVADDQIHWTLQFTKKKSEQASRIRMAVDTKASDIGELLNVRGTGLASEDEAGTNLKVEQMDGLTWYVGAEYSSQEETGILQFSIPKEVDRAEDFLPLKVIVDKQPDRTQADKEKAAALVKQLTRGKHSFQAPNPYLGPSTSSDPYTYEWPDANASEQRRYPAFATNDYTSAEEGPFQLGIYNGTKSPLYSGNQLIDDSDYTKGGANWRNYNYATDNGATGEESGSGRAKTVQLWGEERNFVNSYLDYNGAYIKKWVEPITDHVNGDDDKTTIHNVYLDIIGGVETQPQPLDIVFVLDKSSSMTENILDNRQKNTVLKESVADISETLLNDRHLDVRIGMVNFRGYPKNGLKSDELGMTDDIRDIKNQQLNQALYYNPATDTDATPLALGLRKGYEMLYKDNGEQGRDPLKVMIVIGDGTPTFSYSGFRSYTQPATSDVNWSNTSAEVAPFWTKDSISNPLFRDYESSAYASFGQEVYYPNEFDMSQRPADGKGTYFKFGEVSDSGNTDQWYGNGSMTNQTMVKDNAVQSVAYHHWLREKYVTTQAKEPNIYAIGLGLESNSGNLVQEEKDALGRNVLKNIADLKDNGSDDSWYYSADNAQELTDALKSISGNFIRTIDQAILYDQTGLNVSLYNAGSDAEISFYHLNQAADASGVRYEEPELWDEAKHGKAPQKVEAYPMSYMQDGVLNHAYRFEPISLGEGEMVRIKYQVKLDGGAQNGNFYTVNNQAYIQNGKDYGTDNGKMFFPAPSIRYLHPQRNMRIVKYGNDNEPLKGVTFGLFTEDPNAVGNENIQPVASGITTDDGIVELDYQFNVLDNEESDMYYVKELSGPAWYQLSEETIQFKVKKVLRNMSTEDIGHYELVDGATSGNKVADPDPKSALWPWMYTGANHELSIVQTTTNPSVGGPVWDELYINLEMKNEFKPLQIEVSKLVEGSDTALNDAEFALYAKQSNGTFSDQPIAKGKSGQTGGDGQVQFYQLDSQGNYDPATSPLFNIQIPKNADILEYKLMESKAPDGFVTPDENSYWLFQFDAAGTLQFRHVEDVDENGNPKWTTSSFGSKDVESDPDAAVNIYHVDITNDLDKKELLVRKVDQNNQTLNGVGFDIRRIKPDGSKSSTYRAYTGIPSAEDGGADGIGQFYNLIVDGEKYEDQNFNDPLLLTPGDYELEEVTGLLGYVASSEVYKFTLTMDGRFVRTEDGGALPSMFSYDESSKTLTVTVENTRLPLALEMLKVDRADPDRAISGAEFSISKKDGNNWGAAEPLATDQAGSLFLKEPLEEGVYRIQETKAPAGYQKLSGYFELTVATRESSGMDDGVPIPNQEKGTIVSEVVYVDAKGNRGNPQDVDVTVDNNTRVVFSFSVTNDPMNPLPSTGGEGRLKYMLLTLSFFVAASGLYLIYNKQKKRGAKK